MGSPYCHRTLAERQYFSHTFTVRWLRRKFFFATHCRPWIYPRIQSAQNAGFEYVAMIVMIFNTSEQYPNKFAGNVNLYFKCCVLMALEIWFHRRMIVFTALVHVRWPIRSIRWFWRCGDGSLSLWILCKCFLLFFAFPLHLFIECFYFSTQRVHFLNKNKWSVSISYVSSSYGALFALLLRFSLFPAHFRIAGTLSLIRTVIWPFAFIIRNAVLRSSRNAIASEHNTNNERTSFRYSMHNIFY